VQDTLAARKHDDHNSRRDFWMKIAVIVLIAGEIALSFYFGLRAVNEGKEQAEVLSHI